MLFIVCGLWFLDIAIEIIHSLNYVFEQRAFEITHPRPLSRGELGLHLNYTPLFYIFIAFDIAIEIDLAIEIAIGLLLRFALGIAAASFCVAIAEQKI